MHFLEKKLDRRRLAGNLRMLKTSEALIDFASNDYLGLANRCLSLECTGRGATGSRLLTGNSPEAEALEMKLSAFHGYEAGLLFNCGYMANLGLITTVAKEDDTILYDEAIHASVRDGIRISRARALSFFHNDLLHLEKRLKRASRYGGERFICIESLYSTDGSQAPLQAMCELASAYKAHLLVDEAHAVGVLGPQGRGLVAEYGLQSHVFAQVVTFGKAVGAFGSIVLGSKQLQCALINSATSFVYTTALPYSVLEIVSKNYEVLQRLESERAHLQKLMRLFSSETHIVAIPIPGNEAVQKAKQVYKEKGFEVSALMSPTVRRGQEMLRISLHAFNTEDEVLRLKELCKKL